MLWGDVAVCGTRRVQQGQGVPRHVSAGAVSGANPQDTKDPTKDPTIMAEWLHDPMTPLAGARCSCGTLIVVMGKSPPSWQ